MSEALTIEKFVGAGNDFLFIDESRRLPGALEHVPRPALARRLCDRHYGAGADGLIFMKIHSPGNLRWDFYNSDGSHAEMCGNASRCVGRWAESNLKMTNVKLETAAGLVRIEARMADVTSYLDYLELEFRDLAVVVNSDGWKATLVNTGVPHAVIEIDDLVKARAADFQPVIQAFRFHPEAGPRGANVTFVRILPGSSAIGARRFETVTFERGVEGFTLACGTGVLAAAAVGLRGLGLAPAGIDCEVRAPGGTLKAGFGADWKGAHLTGAAEFIYKADFSVNAMKDDKP